MVKFAPDVRLLWAPSATYDELVRLPERSPAGSWFRAALRVAIPAAVAGIVTSVMATGRISWSLAVSGTVCWSILSLVQVLTAATVLLGRPRRLGLARAIDLFFLGHGAWSLWLLASATAVFVSPSLVPPYAIIFGAAIPFVCTGVVLSAYCRRVLGWERRSAAIRALVHQALSAVIIVLYVGWAVQLWPRLLSLRIP